MKIVCHNQKMLGRAVDDMYNKLSEYGSLSLEYGKPFKDKTQKQLGFFWGALIDSIYNFFIEQGNEYTPDEIKENIYQAISPRKNIMYFNGKQYTVPKRISEMNLEEMSKFIDATIRLCDNDIAFEGLVLHPSIRYTFIRHLEPEDIRNIDTSRYPVRCSEYLDHIRKQACICCGRFNLTEAHHLKELGLSGVSMKCPDAYTIPLCYNCHREYHQKGKEEFLNNISWVLKYLSLPDFCLVCFNRWYNKT